MNVRKILSVCKNKINFYSYLYLGVTLMSGRMSFNKYKRLKADLKVLKSQYSAISELFPVTCLYPCYSDQEENAGSLSFHYFFQDLYVANCVKNNNPNRHVDIGSRIDGFVAHVASFREIEVLDIRPMQDNIPNVVFHQADLMRAGGLQLGPVDSVSCLHALEHFGLGRYGDPICYDGYFIGFKNITNLLDTGGRFYFSVPMGEQRIEFHAHRVFSLKFLLEMITPFFDIRTFSYVDDSNSFHKEVKLTQELIEANCGCHFGCAIFDLIKK